MLSLLLYTSAASAIDDEVVLTTFQPTALLSYDARSAAHLGGFDPGPLGGALGLAIGPDGLLYVASEASNQILRFDPMDRSFVDAFVSDDPSTPLIDETGGLDGPSEVAFDAMGRLYVASFNSDAVLRYDGATGAFDSVFVQPGSAGLNGPDLGMTFGPNGDLYVPSYWTHVVKRYDAQNGAFVSDAFSAVGSGLRNPRDVLFLDTGVAFVASEGSDQVLSFDALTGAFLGALVTDDFSTPGFDESGGLDGPVGIQLSAGGQLLVVSVGTDQVKRYDATTGAYLGDFVPSLPAPAALPTGLLVRPVTSVVCGSAVNSTGAPGRMLAAGSTSMSGPGLALHVSALPAGQIIVLFAGTGFFAPALHGNGILCLGNNRARVALGQSSPSGRALLSLAPASLAPIAGQSLTLQALFADPFVPGSAGFNSTNNLVLRIVP